MAQDPLSVLTDAHTALEQIGRSSMNFRKPAIPLNLDLSFLGKLEQEEIKTGKAETQHKILFARLKRIEKMQSKTEKIQQYTQFLNAFINPMRHNEQASSQGNNELAILPFLILVFNDILGSNYPSVILQTEAEYNIAAGKDPADKKGAKEYNAIKNFLAQFLIRILTVFDHLAGSYHGATFWDEDMHFNLVYQDDSCTQQLIQLDQIQLIAIGKRMHTLIHIIIDSLPQSPTKESLRTIFHNRGMRYFRDAEHTGLLRSVRKEKMRSIEDIVNYSPVQRQLIMDELQQGRN